MSLVGELCPDTVRLFCEASQLTNLRLSYNGNSEIKTFFPDSQPSVETRNLGSPAFVRVNLTNVVREPSSQVADYCLYLTVDLFQLQAQKIKNISCGNADVVDTKLVNVIIEPERIPDPPSIRAVNITYQLGELTLLEVTWDKAKVVACICCTHSIP